MKKLYLALLSAFLCVSAFAQKPVVVVDYFTSPSCTEAGVSALRGHVIAGLAETERINIIDVESEASLAVTQAHDLADEIIKQAETLSKLRERKVISETEKLYSEMIKKVIENIV